MLLCEHEQLLIYCDICKNRLIKILPDAIYSTPIRDVKLCKHEQIPLYCTICTIRCKRHGNVESMCIYCKRNRNYRKRRTVRVTSAEPVKLKEHYLEDDTDTSYLDDFVNSFQIDFDDNIIFQEYYLQNEIN